MYSSYRFSGVLTPVITPFDERLRTAGAKLVQQCEWLLSQQVGLAVFGTNSEANSLSVDEKIDLLDQLVAAGIDPSQLMPGSGHCALPDTVRLARHIATLGCGGTLMLPPFYYKSVTDDGLYRSYAEIIERVGSDQLRIYLYHIPPVAQVGLSLALIEKLLSDYPGVIVGIKDSSGDWSNTLALLGAGLDDFAVFAGSEDFLLENMRNGGAGCISATANVNPAPIQALYANWQSPDADDQQRALSALRAVIMKYPMIPALKAINAHYSGEKSWAHVRPPLLDLDTGLYSELMSSLDELNFSMPGLASDL